MFKVQELGRWSIDRVAYLGRFTIFLSTILCRRPQPFRSLGLLVEQLYSVGVLSFLIVVVSALFVGMVLALQGFHTLSQFGATQELGQLVALAVVRELGPVMTALLFAGRAGSALAAEIGLMKTTDQLSALEIMGVDPVWWIISPRFWAGIIAVPVLAALFSGIAILGGYLVGVLWLGIDAGSFWGNMQAAVDFRLDILSGLLKSVAFGFVVSWIAVFQGHDCEPTAAGMAKATTQTVVFASLAILGLDFILTTMMIGGW